MLTDSIVNRNLPRATSRASLAYERKKPRLPVPLSMSPSVSGRVGPRQPLALRPAGCGEKGEEPADGEGGCPAACSDRGCGPLAHRLPLSGLVEGPLHKRRELIGIVHDADGIGGEQARHLGLKVAGVGAEADGSPVGCWL